MAETLLQTPGTSIAPEQRGVVSCYLEFCLNHLPQLGGSIAERDLASVSRIAHTLKGNAGIIGLSEISSLGGELEQYCLGEDWAAIGSAYRAIADTIARLHSGASLRVEVEQQPGAPAQTVEVKSIT